MKNLLIIICSLITTVSYGQTEWKLDKNHSSIRFSSIHMVISEVVGKINEFDGIIVSPKEDFDGSSIDFTAKVSSIDTDNERRDNHLKSDDFFNAEAHPDITFKGKIEKEGDNYFLVGNFTIRETTKKVRFDVKYIGQIQGKRGRKAGFKVTGIISRFDYGLKWDNTIEAGGLVVGEEITITCNLELNEVVTKD